MRQCCDRELRGNSQDNELYYLDTIKSYKPINNLRSGFFKSAVAAKEKGKRKGSPDLSLLRFSDPVVTPHLGEGGTTLYESYLGMYDPKGMGFAP